MDDHSPRRKIRPQPRRRSWCCSFAVPPTSPETLRCPRPKTPHASGISSKHAHSSSPNSPPSSKSGLCYRRRILSPGRVSPIDPIQEIDPDPSPAGNIAAPFRSESFRVQSGRSPPVHEENPSPGTLASSTSGNGGEIFDVRLNLKGKNGCSLVLELSSEALCANSAVFANLITEHRKRFCGQTSSTCRIEICDVEDLSTFRLTIELIFEEDITKKLVLIGVDHSIDVLEVSAGIMFTKGVQCCLKYLEAVPWNEEEEEKLRCLFTRLKFDESSCTDILSRLNSDSIDSHQKLARQIVWSVIDGANTTARNELKSFVKSLLCKSSVSGNEDLPGLNKEDLYIVCEHCLGLLVTLFEDDGDHNKPLIERVSRQVDNIIWLLEILADQQMADKLVVMWADCSDLTRLHGNSSPIVRFEVSRVSAMLFIAIGTGKLQCQFEARTRLFQSWFGPMLLDFGWLKRCRRGLDMKILEEAMGQAILTLPLEQQHLLFMEWFQCFSNCGAECPNLGKAFQIWWRRSSCRALETSSIEFR